MTLPDILAQLTILTFILVALRHRHLIENMRPTAMSNASSVTTAPPKPAGGLTKWR